ncbi:MAG: hypothetical protein ACRYE9_02630 [Janthinobacterium lividum]
MYLDFGIRNTNYLGKGLASPTLKEFVSFYHKNIDLPAYTCFINPDEKNQITQHIYNQAGFKKV